MRNPHHVPRVAYCNGCDTIFLKMHFLREHRNEKACGGRFLPLEERRRINILRLARETKLRKARLMASAAPAR